MRKAPGSNAPQNPPLVSKWSDSAWARKSESDGLYLRLFEVRQEERAYFTAGPGEPSDSTESSAGEYLAVDYLLENTSETTRALVVSRMSGS